MNNLFLVSMERSVESLWNTLRSLESSWEQSTADGFRRLSTELHHDKAAFSQGLQDLRSVLSTEITARRRDAEQVIPIPMLSLSLSLHPSYVEWDLTSYHSEEYIHFTYMYIF